MELSEYDRFIRREIEMASVVMESLKEVKQGEREGSFDRARFRHYEKPRIVKLTKMTFPLDLIEAAGKGVVCRQCSSCHGCR